MPDKDRTANLSRMDDQLSVLAGIAIVHSDLNSILAGCVDCTDREKVYVEVGATKKSTARSRYRRAMVSEVPGPPTAAV